MDRVGRRVPVIAKLEKPEAIDNLEAIVLAFDAVMVARGDLGVELPLEEVPLVQKRAIQMARENAKPVIVATQMLESMIENFRPTRAEASDVANAVLDGADAVMLSGETSVGKHPIEAVKTMSRIIAAVEQNSTAAPPLTHVPRTKRGVISYAARDIGERLDAKALVAFTQSGDTVRRLARLHTPLPLLAFTDRPEVRSQLALTWGTETFIVRHMQSHRRHDPPGGQVAARAWPLQARRPCGHRRGRSARHSRLDQPDPCAPDRRGRPIGEWFLGSDFEQLLATLDLQRIDDTTFAGSHPRKTPIRTFGGQLMAQSFVAASRTVTTGLPPASLPVTFINGGDPKADIEYQVMNLRDETPIRQSTRGRHARRQSPCVGDGFVPVRRPRSGAWRGRSGSSRPAHMLPPIGEYLRGYEDTVPGFVNALRPIEWRYANDPAWVMRKKGGKLPYNRVWMKADGTMPDDPVLHTAAMVYSSDTTVLDSIITTHGLSWGYRPDFRGHSQPFGVVSPSSQLR